MTHADNAARLAKSVEKDNPAAAGVIYALLALAEVRSGDCGWHKLEDYDDLPSQLEQDYIFEYPDGDQAKWRLSADNPMGVYQFVSLSNPGAWKDSNDLVEECTRWRWG
ncbi:hypothetical protein [Curtobacterium citreum]|uniref:hypothetical protein n=1 Tax=Curtobacterium citreum TaxID=2036 RepID=UPI0025428D7D|nr:hypothetical protein [Curtobacterium citreum]WIJ46186.1 hypothetical protein QPK07_04255 [Curtobacterium citreum]